MYKDWNEEDILKGFKFKPDKNRTFTTKEIAQAFGTSIQTVRNFAHYRGLQPVVVKKQDSGKVSVWNYDFYKMFSAFWKSRLLRIHAKEIKEKEQVTNNLEELKKQHPLVVDFRCFKLSWWPEVIPECFLDID